MKTLSEKIKGGSNMIYDSSKTIIFTFFYKKRVEKIKKILDRCSVI